MNSARSFQSAARAKPPVVEETLVIDERASRRPAEAVEQKLCQMLGRSPIGISQLRMKDLLTARSSNT
jgi:hypothetical protein